MMRLLLLSLFALPTTVFCQDRPLPPKDAAKAMKMPEGFQATLFAGEPDVVQPIAMTFDDRGRLWVVECRSYPKWIAKGEGADSVVMFEDTDGDGVFDKRQVILDKGTNLSGIELGFGGIWLCSLPNLIFIPCDFNADAPKIGKPEVLLDGWGMKCQHNVFNSLTWGPDGWLYGCNGIIETSYVGKPGTNQKDRVPMNCGVFRYHPTKKVFEVFAHGTTNPFGLDFDDYGECFITNCVIGHLWHVIPGAHYERMYGEDFNKNLYALMGQCADHIHWGGGDWTTSRGGKGIHSEAGGGHAHVGCMVYLGDNWPDKYRNGAFMFNLHGNRVNHDRLERKGSGYVAKHEPDFLFANDPWFRGIAIKYGPDGGVYMSDWTDTGECHNYEKVDPSNGRIFKVTFGKPKVWKGDISKLSDAELVKLQTHKNDWFVRHARRVLQERSLSRRKIEGHAVAELRKQLEADDVRVQLRALWSLFCVEELSLKTLESLIQGGKFEQTQAWAVRLTVSDDGFFYHSTASAIAELAADKRSSPFVKMAIASTAQRMSTSQERRLIDGNNAFGQISKRETVVRELIRNKNNAEDPSLALMIWYAVEPFAAADEKIALELLWSAKIPIVQEYLTRRLVSLPGQKIEARLEPILKMLIKNTIPNPAPLAKGIEDAVSGYRQLTTPESWPKAYALLRSRDHARAARLAVLFGDTRAIAELHSLAADASARIDIRQNALAALASRGGAETVDLMKGLLQDTAMRGSAIRGLAAFKNDDTPKLLLAIYAKLTEAEKADAVQTLASRPAWALKLLEAVEEKQLPRADVSVFVARQIQGLKDKQVQDKLAKVWGKIQPASKEKAEQMVKWKKLLTPETLKAADLSKGRLVFARNCAACHRLYDDGGDIGPALTGSQRHNVDYVLENVLDPSAVVAREYQMVKIDTQSGRTINGIIKQETDKAVTIQTPNERIVLPKDEIEKRAQSSLSMMPEGIFDKLKEEEIRDLVAYLATRQQTPLPKGQ